MFKQALRGVEIERDAARRAAEEILESLIAHKAELQGALTTIYILAQRNGGSVSITDAELVALPKGVSVRAHSEDGTHTYAAQVPATPETPTDVPCSDAVPDPAPITQSIPGTADTLSLA